MELIIKKIKKVGRPVVYIHPLTGEYEIPMDPDVEMPLRYKMRGFERREFTSYHEHAAWCRSKGLINHYVEDVRNDDDATHSGNKDSLGN